MEGSKEHKEKRETVHHGGLVLCDRLPVALTGHLTPLTSTGVRRRWRALLVRFKEVELKRHATSVRFYLRVFVLRLFSGRVD